MCKKNLIYYIFSFCMLIKIDFIIVVYSYYFSVGWYCKDLKIIYAIEFFSFCSSCTSHSRKFVVEFEKVLISDGSKGFRFSLDCYFFFGFYGLVQSLRKSSAYLCTTCIFVNDNNFAIVYEIFFAIYITSMCFERVFDMMNFFVS